MCNIINMNNPELEILLMYRCVVFVLLINGTSSRSIWMDTLASRLI